MELEEHDRLSARPGMRKDEEEGDVDDSTADDDEDWNNGEDDVTIDELVDVVEDANAGDNDDDSRCEDGGGQG